MHLFLVSSPLQAISATNIRLQYLKDVKDKDILLFCEGGEYESIVDSTVWNNIIFGRNTRPSIYNAKDNIRFNLKLIESFCQDKSTNSITLYISDLYWLFNNVVFAHMSKQFSGHFSSAIYDEGVVMYAKQQLSVRDFLLSLKKYIWIKVNGFQGIMLRPSNYEHRNPLVEYIYCYHPELFENNLRRNKAVTLYPEIVIPSIIRVTGSSAPIGYDANSLLFLSQPLYRIMDEEDYKAIIINMMQYFSKKGISNFVVKPHPADKKEWMDYLINDLGFKVFPLDSNIAIEAYAHRLNFGYVVSFTSSALLNLNKFGFKGKSVSYGINAIPDNGKANKKTIEIFKKAGIEVIFAQR